MSAAKKARSADVLTQEVTPEQFARLATELRDTKKRMAELEARLRQREEEHMSRAQAARAARVGRAAQRAGLGVEAWLAYCKRVRHGDPTVLDEATKKRIAG
jgi:hypothetical protein